MTSPGQTDERTPLDKALDLGVFAPVGFVCEFRRVVPGLAEAGRRHLALSRSLGKAALRTMSRSSAAKTSTAKANTATKPRDASAPVSGRPAPRVAEPVRTNSASSEKKTASNKAAAVAGYDALTAREIIERSRNATEAQRAWMISRETDGKARVTVLRALNVAR